MGVYKCGYKNAKCAHVTCCLIRAFIFVNMVTRIGSTPLFLRGTYSIYSPYIPLWCTQSILVHTDPTLKWIKSGLTFWFVCFPFHSKKPILINHGCGGGNEGCQVLGFPLQLHFLGEWKLIITLYCEMNTCYRVEKAQKGSLWPQ